MPQTAAEKKAAEARRVREVHSAFLGERIAELHASGEFPGALARTEADRQWGEEKDDILKEEKR
jgi:hypothetical protein